MRYFRLYDGSNRFRLCAEVQPGQLVDLTAIRRGLTRLEQLADAASLSSRTIDGIVLDLLDSPHPLEMHALAQIVENSRDGGKGLTLRRPFDPPEVWAAGVTYKNSEMERKRESGSPDVYAKVYAAERPELFFKSTAARCSGPFESIGIRADSNWNVPEPELAFTIYQGEIIGYTNGNDVSSRTIEGENPLYLPQAKIYDRSCSIGPCFATAETVNDPHELTVRVKILRDGDEVFSRSSSTSLMARRCEQIAQWLQKHNPVPDMTTVLTGTDIVPPPEFTLQQDDVVVISIDVIGELENRVTVV